MSEIDEALAQLFAIEEDLEITSPIGVGIKKVWPYTPPSSQVITDTPAIVHAWTLPELQIGSAILREAFVVNMRLLVYDADMPRAAAIASAFWPKIRYALSQNVKLGLQGWSLGPIAGGSPTLTTFRDEGDVSGKTFVGLDLNLTLYHHLGTTNAAGSPP